MVRNSNQDALSTQEFERLVSAVDELDPEFQAETMLILFAGGRLGMRAGEIAHMQETWIDWERKRISIPWNEPCTKGENGDVCGYCLQQAMQAVEHNPDRALQDELNVRWKPKTSNSARSIPFDFDPRIEAVITTFFDEHSEYPHSRASINRRVDRVLAAADMHTDKCYPHALRATAASWHAYEGLNATALQTLFGWNKLVTAEKYIRLSGEATAKALRDVHSD